MFIKVITQKGLEELERSLADYRGAIVYGEKPSGLSERLVSLASSAS